jgi:hypothetical protein
MSTPAKTKSLHDAAAAFAEKTGMNAKTIALVTETFLGLLAARWEHICDAAYDEDNGGKISVSMSMNLNFQAKTPVGDITLRFVPKTVKDSDTFAVEDPDQPLLPGRTVEEAMAERRPRRGRAVRTQPLRPPTPAPRPADGVRREVG